MKIKDIIEEGAGKVPGYQLVRNIVHAFNTEFSGDEYTPLDVKSPGTRVWTRFDRTRYREPGLIRLDPYGTAKFYKKWKSKQPVQMFWKWLSSQPGVRSIGQVSGEFGSSEMRDAVAYKGLYFALTSYDGSIEWGSTSRFRNPRSVWRHKAPEPPVSAKMESLSEGKKQLKRLPKLRNKELHDKLMSKRGGSHYTEKTDYKRSKEKAKFRKQLREE